MSRVKAYFLDKANAFFEDVRSFRRHMHQFPELSFQEYETQKFISSKLLEKHISGTVVADTGYVVELGAGDNCIALRADIDALPIDEKNETSYVSQNQGVMHACGHDVHASCLYGALLILKEIEGELDGMVRALFQPGEEMLPGGALKMIEAGVLESPRPKGIIALHVFPDLEAGKTGFRKGVYMASGDEIYITFKGKGGHGALPHKCVDPIILTAQFLTNIQAVVSRKAPAVVPSVLTFGKINSNGGATNVIPDEVTIEGTFRTFDEEWRAQAHDLIYAFATDLAHAHGAEVDCKIIKGYPPLENNEALTEWAKNETENLLGLSNVVDLPIRMTTEDFAWYSQKVPACFFRLGVRNEAMGIVHPVHTSLFDIDEEALKIGMATMAYLAYQALKK